MKESGIDWIGQIPEEWEISKIKFTTQLNGRIGWQGLTSAEYKEEGPYLITGTDFHNGTINFETAVHIDEKRWLEASQIQVENGDLLITKDGTVGKVAIISGLDDKASLNSGVLRIQTIDEIDRKFLYYVLLSDEFWMWFNYTNSGASTILHLYQNVFDEFTFTFPQKNEQQKIADFLDKKTAQLDKAKALLEEQIQKLKDYRASLIYETVTKGLDKTVPLKDSGIDWIGQVPEGWGVSRLKYYFDIYAGGDIDERNTVEEYSESHPYPVLSNSLENEGVLGYTNKYRFKKNCVTVTGRGDVGKAVYRNIKFYPVVRLLVCVPKSQVDCRFVTYWINSAIIEKNQTAVSQLTIQMLGELIFVNVPFLEQKNIADFLDKKTNQIDKLIQIKNQQIDNINKQRQTLIYDYVTGKSRV